MAVSGKCVAEEVMSNLFDIRCECSLDSAWRGCAACASVHRLEHQKNIVFLAFLDFQFVESHMKHLLLVIINQITERKSNDIHVKSINQTRGHDFVYILKWAEPKMGTLLPF